MDLTEQEQFWSGKFGDEYIERNKNTKLTPNNISLFSKVFSNTEDISSIIELGSNIGYNLIALNSLFPDAELSAVEINASAASILKQWGKVKVFNQSILNFNPDYQRDLVITKGVLIHIAPESLQLVYETMHKCSKKYIFVAEYYSPTPQEITYRGHTNKLFKRDFAGELLDKYKDLELINYGFVYHRDASFPQDDLTWFLLRKQ